MSHFLSVPDAYDRWAASYDGYDNPMVFIATHAVPASLAAVAHGARVFEFGCGTGRNLAALAALGARDVEGCDFSGGMLQRSGSHRTFRHDMTQPLTHPVTPADLVLFCLTLEHVEQLDVPLASAARILAPGGRVAVFEIHPFLSLSGAAAHFVEADGTEIRMPAYPHSFSTFINAFARSGLCVESCREWRPCDVVAPVPPKVLKRGAEFPLLVEFVLQKK